MLETPTPVSIIGPTGPTGPAGENGKSFEIEILVNEWPTASEENANKFYAKTNIDVITSETVYDFYYSTGAEWIKMSHNSLTQDYLNNELAWYNKTKKEGKCSLSLMDVSPNEHKV